jgi:hypothetical protein
MTNKFDITSDNDIYLDSPTLKEVLRACEDLCEYLKVPYDPSKLRVTTDYGTKVIIYYKENDNEI